MFGSACTNCARDAGRCLPGSAGCCHFSPRCWQSSPKLWPRCSCGGSVPVMNTTKLVLSAPLLCAEEEKDLARRIEAGLYAEHLIATGDHRHPHDALRRVVKGGARAGEILFRTNLRLVMKLAGRVANRTGLPLDDLFQEGCLALGDAIRHFDHGRGTRFSTLAHEYVSRALGRAVRTRCGRLDMVRPADGRRSPVRFTELDQAPAHLLACDGGFDEVESSSMDFLDLLGVGGLVLRLRFGIGTASHTRDQAGAALGMSATSVKRIEERALAEARQLLNAERCRIEVIRRGSVPGAVCGAARARSVPRTSPCAVPVP